MTRQRGDGVITLNGQPVRLRLTMVALADMDERLGISGPEDLATVFRSLRAVDVKQVLSALCIEDQHSRDVLIMSDSDVRDALPVMTRLFEEAFS